MNARSTNVTLTFNRSIRKINNFSVFFRVIFFGNLKRHSYSIKLFSRVYVSQLFISFVTLHIKCHIQNSVYKHNDNNIFCPANTQSFCTTRTKDTQKQLQVISTEQLKRVCYRFDQFGLTYLMQYFQFYF